MVGPASVRRESEEEIYFPVFAVRLPLNAFPYFFSATRSFALRDRGFRRTSSSVGTSGFRVTSVRTGAATGSGSGAIRSILFYENSWGTKPLAELDEPEAVLLALRALDTAAESDTATGGVDRRGRAYPIVKIISRAGITTLPEEQLARVYKEKVS
jgi:hypothetical protein